MDRRSADAIEARRNAPSPLSLKLACPDCRAPLMALSVDEGRCPRCAVVYRREGGVWRFLASGRAEVFREFAAQYETVRKDEGRGLQTPASLRALPFRSPSRRLAAEWRIRARSYEALVASVIVPLERASARPLRVLDLGSGVGWLAYRLTLRGHAVAAVDLLTNDFDGLGTHRHYDRPPTSVQAEFDRLPFESGSIDLVVYNAAFHYSLDYGATLVEALRVLAPSGRIAILDSPLYVDASSGAAMVSEREASFRRRYGFAKGGMPTESFLTFDRLRALEERFPLRWEVLRPWYGLRWWLKPWIARVRGLREPARFALVVGRVLETRSD